MGVELVAGFLSRQIRLDMANEAGADPPAAAGCRNRDILQPDPVRLFGENGIANNNIFRPCNRDKDNVVSQMMIKIGNHRRRFTANRPDILRVGIGCNRA